MSRVFRRFMKKVFDDTWPVLKPILTIAAPITGYTGILHFIFKVEFPISMLVGCMLTLASMLVFMAGKLIYEWLSRLYQEAKHEVSYENKRMMDAFK